MGMRRCLLGKDKQDETQGRMERCDGAEWEMKGTGTGVWHQAVTLGKAGLAHDEAGWPWVRKVCSCSSVPHRHREGWDSGRVFWGFVMLCLLHLGEPPFLMRSQKRAAPSTWGLRSFVSAAAFPR